ncbi:Kinesin-like protein kif23 [Dermatophagoides farinae]|uniref:Kinesin-like protein kif23 n=1 Tax=Dermatophagoides farinae TaxID=6954 RepID=A0A922HQK8_DERFA|nr:Kinesin-like protein kif23 [Dermatophagoides farinae]
MATVSILRKKKSPVIRSPAKPSRSSLTNNNSHNGGTIKSDEIQLRSMKNERKVRKTTPSIDCVDIEYTSLPPLPDIPILDESFEASIDNEQFPNDWLDAIQKRIQRFDYNEKIEKRNQQRFRDVIIKIEKENVLLKNENENLKADIESRRIQFAEYEKKFTTITEECLMFEADMKQIRMENSRLLYQLNQKEIECQNLQDKLKSVRENIAIVLRAEHEKLKNLLFDSLANKNQMEQKYRQQEAKFQVLQNLFNTDTLYPETMHMVISTRQRSNSESSVSPSKQEKTSKCESINSNGATPVVNPKYDHKTAKTKDKWIDHRPMSTLPMGTIMKPVIKNKKSVTQLKTSDFLDRRYGASKYALLHHEATNSGTIETKIFKGNVIPSSAGGAQIIFNDVELLKQTTPQ